MRDKGNKNFSLIRKLRNEKRLTYDLQVLLNSLTLEEIISLKLELSAKAAGSKLYGLPLWFSISDIVKEAIFTFALSSTKTKGEASRFLGIDPKTFRQLYKKFKSEQFMHGGEMDSTGQ